MAFQDNQCLCELDQRLMFSVKDHVPNILGFVSCVVYVTTIQPCSVKTAICEQMTVAVFYQHFVYVKFEFYFTIYLFLTIFYYTTQINLNFI